MIQIKKIKVLFNKKKSTTKAKKKRLLLYDNLCEGKNAVYKI